MSESVRMYPSGGAVLKGELNGSRLSTIAWSSRA